MARGLARVYSLPDNRACTSELLAREEEARGKRASSAYRIEDAADAKRLGRLIHSYQLIEGTVLNVGEGNARVYLNFAPDWRSDITISIARKMPRPLPLPVSIRRRSPASACACAAGSPGETVP